MFLQSSGLHGNWYAVSTEIIFFYFHQKKKCFPLAWELELWIFVPLKVELIAPMRRIIDLLSLRAKRFWSRIGTHIKGKGDWIMARPLYSEVFTVSFVFVFTFQRRRNPEYLGNWFYLPSKVISLHHRVRIQDFSPSSRREADTVPFYLREEIHSSRSLPTMQYHNTCRIIHPPLIMSSAVLGMEALVWEQFQLWVK